jgi:hypothetical protein
MAGRHTAAPAGGARRRAPARPNRRGARRAVALVAGVLVLFCAAGWSVVRSFGGDRACADGEDLTVAAAPEIAPVVRTAAAQTDAGDLADAGVCTLHVVAMEPADALAGLRADARTTDLWIPDTSAWLARLPAAVRSRAPRSVAKTPVVLAAPGGAARPDSWLQALSQPASSLLDPSTSGASLGALAALHAEAVKGTTSGTALSNWLVGNAQDASPYSSSDAELLHQAGGGAAPASSWFPTTEQRVVDALHDTGGAGGSALKATVPRSGTILLDYPLVPVTTGERTAPAAAAARVLADRLASPAGTRRLEAAGFRSASGAPTDADGGVGTFTEVGVVQPDAVTGLLNTWLTLRTDARMLAVLDVSGSMEEYAGASTRVALARDAVLTALRGMPGDWQVGLWAFSRGLGAGDDDHRALAPVFDLDATSGGSTQRQRLVRAAQALPTLVGGGTGLYDTVLAAYRNAVAGYDPNRFNAVVLLTDGRNDDESGIGLGQLLDTLRAERDPAHPVQVITIGMGPQADTAALARIADSTGAPSYVVRDPRAISGVLNDALLERVGWGLR